MGWAGITDKYWLTALIPDQSMPVTASFRHVTENGADRYQVDYMPNTAQTVEAGATGSVTSHLFAGAKVVQLLDRYESQYHIPNFDKAVDFGWFYFLTKPIFYALDFFYHVTGNFGVAIMIFTVIVKGLFFPLASKSYRSMSRMKLLGPKMTEIRERLKDEPQKMQAEIMQLYKAEKVNPASGCLPMVVQIPVFFSLYKVIFVTIEMRHAPFFGWIHDLSAVDPTNVFTLFGLIPWDPTHYSHFLHLGLWPLIMGCTMFFQQRLNPPPAGPGAGEDLPVHADPVHLHAGELPSRLGDLLELEQLADDPAAMDDHAADAVAEARAGAVVGPGQWMSPHPILFRESRARARRRQRGSRPGGSRRGGCCSRRNAGSSLRPSGLISCRHRAWPKWRSPGGPTWVNRA